MTENREALSDQTECAGCYRDSRCLSEPCPKHKVSPRASFEQWAADHDVSQRAQIDILHEAVEGLSTELRDLRALAAAVIEEDPPRRGDGRMALHRMESRASIDETNAPKETS